MSLASYTIERNECLNTSVEAFYHTDYLGYGVAGNPDYLYLLKNIKYPKSIDYLTKYRNIVSTVFKEDLQIIHNLYSKAYGNASKLSVCVVPRSKARFTRNHLGFSMAISSAVQSFNSSMIEDLSDAIIRIKDTRTTHMRRPEENYDNNGSLPYKGIAKDTCRISHTVIGRDILLVDDIYTKTVDIIEDMAQALYDKGANTVFVYTVGRTVKKY